MADEAVPLTADGKARLAEELETLRGERKAVAERIHNARELGTSQNDAEYEDAKQQQGRIEGRILELEDILHRATIIDEKGAHQSGRVLIGSGIEVEQDGAVRHYQIVGHPEADAGLGKISNESPVAAALLGKKVGDTVEVNVPKGVIKIKLLKID
jgi:transcription elongation factor GreA